MLKTSEEKGQIARAGLEIERATLVDELAEARETVETLRAQFQGDLETMQTTNSKVRFQPCSPLSFGLTNIA